MVPANDFDITTDPVKLLNDVLDNAWLTLCCTYDAIGDLPETGILFRDVDLSRPFQAAKTVLANMLLEMMDNIGRFSPWYTRPARAFGLTSIHDRVNNRTQWMLAPEATMKWQPILDQLTTAIQKNYSLIEAMVLVEDYLDSSSSQDPQVSAQCDCYPPRTIHLTLSVLEKSEIICNKCMQPFH